MLLWTRRRFVVALGTLIAILAIGVGAWFWLQGRLFAPSSAELVAYLPANEGATVYVNAALLRHAGALERIAGPPGTEEADYRKFVAEAGFDFRRDLDAVAARFHNGSIYYIAAGRFDWPRLKSYATSHGGACAGDFCTLPASDGVRRIGLTPVSGGRATKLLAVAVSTDQMAVATIRAAASKPNFAIPSEPVWLRVPGAMLQAQAELPLIVNGLLDALHGARGATFTAGAGVQGIEVRLTAECTDDANANAALERLRTSAEMLKRVAAEAGAPSRDTEPLTVLSSGEFTRQASTVTARWRVPSALVDQLWR